MTGSSDPFAPPADVTLVEAHAHVLQLGRSRTMLDLSACTSPGEMLDAVARHQAERVAAGVGGDVLAHGARPEAWDPPAWPLIDDLDAVTDGAPLVAWCFDYHGLVANTAALARAELVDPSVSVEGGVIERDTAGRPTGVALEAAALRVWDAVPEPGEAERTGLLRAALSSLAALGYRHVDDLKAQTWLGGALRAMHEDRPPPITTRLYPLVEDLPAVAASRGAWECDAVRLGGGKIFVDGTLNSRTAWMLEPFADGHPDRPRGMALMSPDAIEAAVRTCDELGLPMAAHAIGDAAVRAVLDAIERVKPRTPGFRIEHCELIHEDDAPRFAQLGVACSVQPCHLLYDIEALRRAVPDRLGRVLPLRELIDAGCTPGELLLFGSDAPIVRADPCDSIRAAVDRRRAGMDAAEAIAPEQAISRDESLACFQARPR